MACARRLWPVLQGVIVCTIVLFFLGLALRRLQVPGSSLFLGLGVVAAIAAIVLIFFHSLLALAAHLFGWVKCPLSVRVVHCIVISAAMAALLYAVYCVATKGLR